MLPDSPNVGPASRDPQQEPLWAEGLRIISVFALIALAGFSILLVAQDSESWKPLPDNVEIPGLSPAVHACYSTGSKISSLIIAVCLGVALGLTYFFGNFLYKKFRESSLGERRVFWESVSARLSEASPSELSEIISGFAEYEKLILDRRNAYWGLFLRATLALLVVTLIALLIGVCKIESQAGLPIITGIISFVIGQGAEALHGAGTVLVINRTPNQRDGHKTTVSQRASD